MRLMTAQVTKAKYLPMGRPRISSQSGAKQPLAVLVDLMHDRYVEWYEEARTVRDAYKGWSSAPLDRQTELYLSYQEALEQEASAASRYALAVADLNRRAVA